MSQQILQNADRQLLTQDLSAWISQVIGSYTWEPMPGDASTRQYSRLYSQAKTYILMEYLEDTQTALNLFLNIQKPLKLYNLPVPEIIAIHDNLPVAIIEDLGAQTYLDILTADNAELLYKQALTTLVQFHQVNPLISNTVLPIMDTQFLWQQYQVFEEWYVVKHLNYHLDDNYFQQVKATYDKITHFIDTIPKVMSHIDYHSRNIIANNNKLSGIVDFQDAMFAPITYDAASLLKDCYIAWPRYKTLDWLLRFRDELLKAKLINISFLDKDWVQAFDWVGLQRHIKVLGVFARLNYRDNKPRYLQDIPRILDYIFEVTSMYKELHPLHQWLTDL